jgi:hypothetical protein
MNPFSPFFQTEIFHLPREGTKELHQQESIYADQQFTDGSYSGRVASLFENIPFSRKIIYFSLLP